MKANVRKLTTMAMLTAISVVLVALIHLPFPPAPFLEYDPADIPIFIGTFLFGPTAGLMLTFLVAVIQGLTVSAGSGVIGIIMHFFATGTFVLLAGNLYKRNRTQRGAIDALGIGVLGWTVAMVVWNLIFTPLFLGAPIKDVLGMLLPVIIPFNLMKAGINAVVTYFAYKPIARLIKHLRIESVA